MAREKRKNFLTPEEYELILNGYVTSPRHLKLTLDIILPITPTSEVNRIYRSFLWLLFSGMTTDMTVCVEEDDLDFDHMRIRTPRDFTGRVAQDIYRSSVPEPEGYYPIYAEAVEDLRVACSLEKFIDPPRSDRTKDRLQIRAAGTEILRTYKSGENQTGDQRLHNSLKPAIQNAMKRARKHAELSGSPLPKWFPERLACKRVELSGKFYRAYTEERMGTLEWVHPDNMDAYLAWRYSPEKV